LNITELSSIPVEVLGFQVPTHEISILLPFYVSVSCEVVSCASYLLRMFDLVGLFVFSMAVRGKPRMYLSLAGFLYRPL
jgi:hypothetical protein